MARRNVAQTVTFMVWDTSANAGKTGQAGNLTIRYVKDGTEGTPAGSPAEVDATNIPGLYKIALTAAETDGMNITICGKCSTANTSVIPLHMTTQTSADLTAIDGQATSGNNATLKLKSLNIINDAGNALELGGSVFGIHSYGGSAGALLEGSATNSPGVIIQGVGTGVGLSVNSVSAPAIVANSSAQSAIYVHSGPASVGIDIYGGVSGIMINEGQATNATGIEIHGKGNLSALSATADVSGTGNGITVIGRAAGISVQSTTGTALAIYGTTYGVLVNNTSISLPACFISATAGDAVGLQIVGHGVGGGVSIPEITTLLGDTYTLKTDTTTIKGYTDTLESSMTTVLGRLPSGGGASQSSVDAIKTVVDSTQTLASGTSGFVATKSALGVVDTVVDSIFADTTQIKIYTDILDDATNGNASIKSAVVGVKSVVDTINTNTDTIEASCTTIIGDLENAPDGLSYIKTDLASIKADTGAIKLDIENSTTGLVPIKNAITVIDTVVDTINTNTDSLEASMLNVLSDLTSLLSSTGSSYNLLVNSSYGLSALKTAITAVGAQVSDVNDIVTATEGHMPAGTVSNLTFSSLVDTGVTLLDVFQYVTAMTNGRFELDEPNPGQITFYASNGTTVLFIVNVSTTGRSKV